MLSLVIIAVIIMTVVTAVDIYDPKLLDNLAKKLF